ncbi:MAG: hypothetical protein ACRENE_12300 [Polyangiaceae bacterium]
MKTSSAILIALVVATLAIASADHPAEALDGFRCQHSGQCVTAMGELCIADSLTSTWGRCGKLRVLP